MTGDPKDCAEAKTAFDALKLNSTAAKNFISCTMDACGCSAATIAKFGLVMFFGLIGYWFKWLESDTFMFYFSNSFTFYQILIKRFFVILEICKNVKL